MSFLDDLKQGRCSEVDMLLGQIRSAVPYVHDTTKVVALDEFSCARIGQANAIADDAFAELIPWNENFYWWTVDGQEIPMPRPGEMKKLAQWAAMFVSDKIFKSFAHKKAIMALQTIDEVIAYNINEGW